MSVSQDALGILIYGDDQTARAYDSARREMDTFAQDARSSLLDLEGPFSAVQEYALSLSGAFTLVGGAATAIVSGVSASVAALVLQSREIENVNSRLNISKQRVQEYGYAARVMGTDLATIADGMQTFQERIFESAVEGAGEGHEALSQLGISATDAQGKMRDLDEVFLEYVGRLGELDNKQLATTKSLQLMGDSAAENLMPLIKEGPEGLRRLTEEAHELGVVLSDEDVEAANKLAQEIQKLWEVAKSFGNLVAIEFVPGITSIVESMLRGYKAAGVLGSALDGVRESLYQLGVISESAKISRMQEDVAAAASEVEELTKRFLNYREETGRVIESEFAKGGADSMGFRSRLEEIDRGEQKLKARLDKAREELLAKRKLLEEALKPPDFGSKPLPDNPDLSVPTYKPSGAGTVAEEESQRITKAIDALKKSMASIDASPLQKASQEAQYALEQIGNSAEGRALVMERFRLRTQASGEKEIQKLQALQEKRELLGLEGTAKLEAQHARDIAVLDKALEGRRQRIAELQAQVVSEPQGARLEVLQAQLQAELEHLALAEQIKSETKAFYQEVEDLDRQDRQNKFLEETEQFRYSELERLDSWYQEKLALVQGNEEALMRLELEYGRRRGKIEDDQGKERLRQRNLFFRQGNALFRAFGSEQTQLAQGFAAANALINALEAGSQVLRDPTLPFFAKTGAALSIIATGKGFVDAINGGGNAGGGGGSPSVPSLGSPSNDGPTFSPTSPLVPTPVNPEPSRTLIFNIQGSVLSERELIELVRDELEEESQQGRFNVQVNR